MAASVSSMVASLADELDQKFGLKGQARSLIGEILALMGGGAGGPAGFLDRFRVTGASLDPAMAGMAALPVPAVERALGAPVLEGIAARLGLGAAAIGPALGFAIPKMLGLLSAGGTLPAALPPELAGFHPAAPIIAGAEQVKPLHMHVQPEPARSRGWLWPAIVALLVLGGLGLYALNQTTTPVASTATPLPVASTVTPPVTPAPPTGTPAHLAFSTENGRTRYTGAVRDEATRASVVGALASVFGADRIDGSVSVDPARAAAAWLAELRPALADLDAPGTRAVFDGNVVQVGGTIQDADRDHGIGALKSLLGGAFTVGTLATDPNGSVATSLTALHAGYSAPDLVGILNRSVITFPSGSAAVPADQAGFLQTAAAAIKQLPAATILEIAGYTDNTGDPAANVTLSQQRADAIRTILVQAGVGPAMLVSKGYGDASPVGSNELEAGRVRNRRIEYRVVKS